MKLLETVCDTLTAAGIPAMASHPAAAQGEGVVAAVELESLDHNAREAVVLVTVACPGELGGQQCREKAVTAGLALAAMGGNWSQGPCRFQGYGDSYFVELRGRFTGGEALAQWQGEGAFQVSLNNVLLPRATAFRGEQELDETTGLPVSGGPWLFRLEENYTWEQTPPPPPADGFTLKVSRTLSAETYKNCIWISVEVQSTATGLRQIRRGVATSRSVAMLA